MADGWRGALLAIGRLAWLCDQTAVCSNWSDAAWFCPVCVDNIPLGSGQQQQHLFLPDDRAAVAERRVAALAVVPNLQPLETDLHS